MNFSPMRIGETEIFTVDYTELLGDGETLVSAEWSNKVIRGSNPDPDAMIIGLASINGAEVSQKISASIVAIYAPICTAQTSAGQTLILPEPGRGLLQVVA